LVCPIDWGIGHASRDVIIIKKLLEKENDVILGGDGPSLKFLSFEFPALETVRIPSHRFFYSDKFPAWFMILLQVPVFLRGISDDHRNLKKIIDLYRIDLVISDARYGLWNRQIRSVIITHQVRIRMPLVFRPFELIIGSLNRLALQKFTYHWIPDLSNDQNLSGLLSHNTRLASNSLYTGYLSRYTDYLKRTATSEDFEIVILLSGPEPQRSVFEKIVAQQLMSQKRRSVIIGGQIDENPGEKHDISSLCRRIPFVSGEELYSLLISAKYIICRSGYSTIMDLATIGKTAFLVPTPGQTEQEYLALYLQKKGLFRFSDQKEFNLEDAIYKLNNALPDFSFIKNNLLDRAIDALIEVKKSY
jgi:predicted glycosyltransferase